MSFQHKGFWTSKGGVLVADGDTVFDNSSVMEPKCARQWLSAEVFPNKRQAVESPICREELGISMANAVPWDTSPEFQSMPSVPNLFMDRVFGSEINKSVNLPERNMIAEIDGRNVSKKVTNSLFENDPSVGLSTVYAMENQDTGVSCGGSGETNDDQVKDPANGLCIAESSVGLSMDHACNRGNENNSMSMGQPYGKEVGNTVLMVHSYDIGDANSRSMGSTFGKGVDNTISLTRSSKKQDSSNVCFGCYNGEPMVDILSRPVSSYTLLYESCSVQISETHNKPKANARNGQSPRSKLDSTPKSKLETKPARKEALNTFPSNVRDANTRSMGSTFRKGIDNTISLTRSSKKQDSSNVCFGCYNGESIVDILSRPVSSYTLLYEPCSVQTSETHNKPKANVRNGQSPRSKLDSTPKSKLETKPARKGALNSFPSNVRSLLATGILDGVPVKYVSTSREELHGIIKGSGYLCGCQLCNYSKALNAYEFERHADSKSNHPNNHIYFENGKTIYQIVQELKSTPDSMKFDAVETMTGSQINQKAFLSWKGSFQAATRELQRIYRKEELNK